MRLLLLCHYFSYVWLESTSSLVVPQYPHISYLCLCWLYRSSVESEVSGNLSSTTTSGYSNEAGEEYSSNGSRAKKRSARSVESNTSANSSSSSHFDGDLPHGEHVIMNSYGWCDVSKKCVLMPFLDLSERPKRHAAPTNLKEPSVHT